MLIDTWPGDKTTALTIYISLSEWREKLRAMAGVKDLLYKHVDNNGAK